MFDQTLGLFLLNPAPEIKVIKILSSHLSEVVQQIEVKISCSCLFQGCFKLCCRIFSCLAVDPCCVLGGKLEFFSRIALYQCLTDRIFTSCVSPCSIKIRESCVQKKDLPSSWSVLHRWCRHPASEDASDRIQVS